MAASWIFLNTTYDDFLMMPHYGASEAGSPTTAPPVPTTLSTLSLPAALAETMPAADNLDDIEFEDWAPPLFVGISPYGLEPTEFTLLQYFESAITPHCVLPGSRNIYADVFLRMALTPGAEAVRDSVLAVAANQQRLLGSKRHQILTWTYHSRTLARLRRRIEFCVGDHIFGLGLVLACSIMLCFFEVSHACSHSWTAHARCAQSILSHVDNDKTKLSTENGELCELAVNYFASHEVFARTASSIDLHVPWRLPHDSCGDMYGINPIFGCSKGLLDLVSAISGECEKITPSTIDLCGENEESSRHRRNVLERSLHSLKQDATAFYSPTSIGDLMSEQIGLVAEAKRLAALIYLHGRLDALLPKQAPLPELCRELIGVLQRVNLCTTTLLWPLFILAVFGIAPNDEEGRAFVLRTLVKIQSVRQLAHVKKARRIIEGVWKARDLHLNRHTLSWVLVCRQEGQVSLT